MKIRNNALEVQLNLPARLGSMNLCFCVGVETRDREGGVFLVRGQIITFNELDYDTFMNNPKRIKTTMSSTNCSHNCSDSGLDIRT